MSHRLWLLSILLLVVIFAASSYLMLDRIAQEQLLGHLALWQFASFWLLVLFWWKRRAFQECRMLKIYGLATLSAVLLALAFPPFPLPFLLFVAFIPLLVALDLNQDIQGGSVFLILLHTFLLWNIFSTYWVANTAYAAGIFANLVNALLMTLPILVFRFVRRYLGSSVSLVTLVACWVTFEFLHMRWELYWPWLTLGNAWSSLHPLVQWYQITGVLGGSVWVLATNYLIYAAWEKNERSFMVRWGPGVLVIIAPMLISLGIYITYTDRGEEVEMVAIQPNLEPHYEKFNLPESTITDRFLDLSAQFITDSTRFLVFPETSFSGINLDRPLQSRSLQRLRLFLQNYPGTYLITGLSAYRILSQPEDIALPTTRHIERSNGEDLYVEAYNCAVLMDSSGVLSEYYKALYVPGAEFFPFRKVLFFLKPIVDQLGGTLSGYRVRSKYDVFRAEGHTLAPSICYESIFGEYMGRFLSKGSEAIAIITNDGWWDNTAGHKQHAAYARLRAIEARKSIVRSANMGTCAFINQRGDVLQATDYGEMGGIRGTIRLNDEQTFYARWGDYVGRLSLFMTALLFLRAWIKRILPK